MTDSTVVLRGRAVDVVIKGATPDAADEIVGIIFDANVLADMEEKWGSMEEWQIAMATKPFSTLRDTLAIALGITNAREMGDRMPMERIADYSVAVGAAFAIANGVDPTRALATAMAAIDLAEDRRDAAVSALVATRGTDGSELGAVSVDPSESSGL